MKHIARKRFGQHFLTDSGVIDGIVRAIDRLVRWERLRMIGAKVFGIDSRRASPLVRVMTGYRQPYAENERLRRGAPILPVPGSSVGGCP